ncbi:MAG: Holliday junction branch migration protein RuvA [Candidatus Kerfeldbacteria bacterium]|nr:Holliday junction branch migration protein RuvA [Candidatus Kerfeldbacteria bacterium]
MIAQLKGTVSSTQERFVVLDVGGVGYEVMVTRDLAAQVKIGTSLTLYTYLAVREDAQELFGFSSQGHLNFFKLLLTVSGIGPKSALNILDVVQPDDIRRAVTAQDAASLHRLHGVGKKTADRLVTELKDKLEALTSLSQVPGDQAALLEAVIGLGYSVVEARAVVKQVSNQAGTLQDKVKAALKLLSRS